MGDISNAIITIVGDTGYIGINKSSPSTDVDISGDVTINGFLDMSCNPIKDVSGIYFCDGSSLTAGNSLDISGDGIINVLDVVLIVNIIISSE